MRSSHLTEMDIQQFASDEGSCEKYISDHLAGCAGCRAAVAAYRSIFSAIGSAPAPVFEFDLEALVLSAIPETRSAPSAASDRSFLNILVIACIGGLGLPLYLYRAYLVRWFSGLLPVVLWLAILPVLAILVFQGFDLYKKYQKQMNALNY